MTQPRLYHDLAKWWPLLSPVEGYVEEGAHLRAVLREKLGPGRHTLLDLGVGGGHNLSHLTGEFVATGVDLSEEMLAHSRRLNSNVEHHLGDMRTVRLGRTFNAVVILDSVSCLSSQADLRATLQTAAAYLRPGGVLIMAPDWFRETFRDQFVSHVTRCRGDTVLTCIEYLHDPDPADTTVEIVMFFLIREKGQLRIEQDRHTLGLFRKATWLNMMYQAVSRQRHDRTSGRIPACGLCC